MLPTVHNLFDDPTPDASREDIAELISAGGFTLEHILSRSEASPAGFWYDQPCDEWVALVRGSADMEFAEGSVDDGPTATLSLRAGDAITIPARLKHRVASVSSDAVWIALHFSKH